MDHENYEKQVEQGQQENLEDDRKLPSWMLTNQSQSETSQNNETTANSQSSPIPVHHNEGSSDMANDVFDLMCVITFFYIKTTT